MYAADHFSDEIRRINVVNEMRIFRQAAWCARHAPGS